MSKNDDKAKHHKQRLYMSDLNRPTHPSRPSEMIKDLIGQPCSKTTPIGKVYSNYSNITVVGDNGKTGNEKKLMCICDICHQDPELHSEPFFCTKSNLDNKRQPCGCGKSYRWDERQQAVLMTRATEMRKGCDYQYHSLRISSKGRYQFSLKFASNGKVVPGKHGKGTWWVELGNFLAGSTHPDAALASRIACTRDSDAELTRKFIEAGSLKPGGHVTRDTEIRFRGEFKWVNVYCPVCAKDEFAMHGVGPTVFRATIPNMTGVKTKEGKHSGGKLPCRCSPNYQYSAEERQFQVELHLDDIDGTWTGWHYFADNCNDSYFNWTCKRNHKCTTNLNNAIHAKVNCATCDKHRARPYNGFLKDRANEPDNVYILLFKHNITGKIFVKVGRAFNIENRKKRYARDYNATFEQCIFHHKNIHLNCWEVEQEIIFEFERYVIEVNGKYGRETFLGDAAVEMAAFARQILARRNNKG